MTLKASNLMAILGKEYNATRFPYPIASASEFAISQYWNEINSVFASLGGKGAIDVQLFLHLTHDMVFENFAIQLDEEINFNRYRNITLSAANYETNGSFSIEKYKGYCRNFEKECLRSASHGQSWTNAYAEFLFGKAGENGELYKEGAPAWKLNAFKEYLIDISALIKPVNLLRISVYDNLLLNSKMYILNDLLLTSRPDFHAAVFKNIDRKIKLFVPKEIKK